MSAAKSVLLGGLQPQPLASYLAALGLLRVAAEQWNPGLRGRWSPEGFIVEGADESEILAFLLERYEPTPIVAPWAGGGGFAEGEDTSAIDAIRSSTTVRLQRYREVIELVRVFPELPPRGLVVRDVKAWAGAKINDASTKQKLREDLQKILVELSATTTPDEHPIDECKQSHPAAKIFTQLKAERRQGNKTAIAARCRNELPDECVCWMDAALVLFVDDHGELTELTGPLSKDAMKPRLEFSRLFMEAISSTLLASPQQSARLAQSMLTGASTTGLVPLAPGLFELGSAGGFNMGAGFKDSGIRSNPWTIAMTFEGCVAWSGAVSRRAGAVSSIATVGPFTTRHIPAGTSGASPADSKRALTELWAPLWARPATAPEILGLLAEGRARVNGREPRDGIEFAEAVASLGVDRGISSFVRFSIVERRGPSYLASPIGRLDVSARREIDLLAQLDRELRYVDRLFRGFPSDAGPPAHMVSLRRQIDDARFQVAARGGQDAMTRLMRAVGALEMTLARRDPTKEPRLPRPLGSLGVEWIDACGDSVEVRLASALASVAATGGAGGMRCYLAPLDPDNPGAYAPAARATSWAGIDLSERLASVLQRRMLDVRARSTGDGLNARNPTWGPRKARLDEVACFLHPELVDERALEELLFGFTWVRPDWTTPRHAVRDAPPLPRDFSLLKLLFLPEAVPCGREKIAVAPDGAILPLLRAGRINDAVERASATLRAKGLRPRRVTSDAAVLDASRGRRLAAALLIPLAETDALLSAALIPVTDSEELEETIDAR